METTVSIGPEFWNDGSIWTALSAHTEEGASLAEFALHELKVKDWCFFQTSGSEGRRKWVGLTKESMLISARAVNAHFDITKSDHWLLALPTHHVGGFGVLARAFVSESRVSKFEGKWDALAFVRRCDEVGATLASLVPTQIFDLVAAKLRAPKSMRVVLVGGGVMNAGIESAARSLGWPLRRTYGMTETASGVAAQATESGEMEVLPIWKVATDSLGVLTVRGEALAQGYASKRNGTWHWDPISAEKGLQTRDRVSLSYVGQMQFLRFLGRENNTIKILGELVALGPIQERIETLRLELGFVEGDAAVCDVPDLRQEARLVLATSGMSFDRATLLHQRLNEASSPLERCSEVRQINSIPRSDLGKLRREELRNLL